MYFKVLVKTSYTFLLFLFYINFTIISSCNSKSFVTTGDVMNIPISFSLSYEFFH